MSTEPNPVTATTLDAQTLETAADIRVFDSQGGEVRFGDIFVDSKTVIVFIRTPITTTFVCTYRHPYLTALGHFFCGVSHVSITTLTTWDHDII